MCMIKKIIILFSLALVFANIRTIAQKTNLSSKEFEKGIANADIQILDVRTQGEYNSGQRSMAKRRHGIKRRTTSTIVRIYFDHGEENK